jgi:flagella basal body P-ring formation protein FlgA
MTSRFFVLGVVIALAGSASADSIESIIRATPGLPAGLAVAKVHLPAKLARVDADPARVVVELPRELRAGRASWKLAVRGRTVFVPVTLGKEVEVAILTRPLAVGQVIAAGDFMIELRASEAPAVSPQLLEGATASRPLETGATVNAGDVSLPAPLPRGTPIKIEIQHGAVRVRGSGLLERAARPGEAAIARLSHTRSIVRGTLRAPATLVVEE